MIRSTTILVGAVAAAALLNMTGFDMDSAANAQTSEAEDINIWLEEVEGEKALEWARGQNNESLPRLEGDGRFKALQEAAEAIYTASDRIPYGSLHEGVVTNFWQDERHVRGVLRRTSLASYSAAEPEWETVLDIDGLAEAEDENWVYKGSTCLAPENRLCMMRLSRGGKDAAVMREFDKKTKSFVDGGFMLPEAKGGVTWVDADTLIVGTDFGPGTLTDSGYARTVRLWKRGSDIADAPVLYEGLTEDVWVNGQSFHQDGAPRRTFVQRGIDFYTEEMFFVGSDGTAQPIDLPVEIEFQGVFDDRMLVYLRADWTRDDMIHTAGSLVAIPMTDVEAGEIHTVETVFGPDDVTVLDTRGGVQAGKSRLYLNIMKNVKSEVRVASRNGSNWTTRKLDLPDNGTTAIMAVDDATDALMINYESFLVPDALYYAAAGEKPVAIKHLPPRFDASGFLTEQMFATSADGTEVPYFVVRSKNLEMNGQAPTLLYGYGGFEISLKPSYVSPLALGWLQQGGVYVVANIRGGGEYGPKWHQAALLENRQRAYDDFIAIAEDLISRGITSPEHLGIRGGSNGGLLTGAVAMQRPELFSAVITAVPLLDMMRYHTLLAGASWMAEYGDPDNPEDRAFIEKYSPYQNIQADVDYPEIFFWTNTMDDRVHPGHARKMVARMRQMGHEVMYFENTEGGHGGGANLKQQSRTTALELTYLLQKLKDEPGT